jgi:hypothetical protein
MEFCLKADALFFFSQKTARPNTVQSFHAKTSRDYVSHPFRNDLLSCIVEVIVEYYTALVLDFLSFLPDPPLLFCSFFPAHSSIS